MNTVTEPDNLKAVRKICENSDYEIFQDEIFMKNAKTGSEHYGIDLSHCTPTFILKVDQSFLAVIIQGTKKIAFKKLKKYLGTDKIRMATAEEIMQITGAVIGSVSMINPEIRTLIDNGIYDLDYCYGGCGVEKFTLKISAKNLVSLTRAEGGDFADVR